MTTEQASIYHKRRHAASTTDEYLFHQLVPYLGNKRRLLHLILDALAHTGTLNFGQELKKKNKKPAPIFVDLFAGSGVVSRLARQHGYRVIANDWEPYSYALNHAILSCIEEPEFRHLGGYQSAIDMLNHLPEVKVGLHIIYAQEMMMCMIHNVIGCFLNVEMVCDLMPCDSKSQHGKHKGSLTL